MIRRVVVAGLVVAASIKIWYMIPKYPEGIENITLGTKILGTVFVGLMEAAIMAERIGLINDTAALIQPMFNSKLNYTSPIDGVVEIEHRAIENVPVILFRPQQLTGNLAKTIVYFHGGGFMLGSPMMHFKWTLRLAKETNSLLISVDYRLAPQNPFPAGVDDCLKVTKAVFDLAESLGVDRDQVAVAGDSAGANLAAVVAIDLADSTKYQLKAQMLISPILLAAGVHSLPSQILYTDQMQLGFTVAKYAGLRYTRSIETAFTSGRHIAKASMDRIKRYLNISSLPDDLLALIPDHVSAKVTDSGANDRELRNHPKEVAEIGRLALDQRAWPLIFEDETKLSQVAPALVQISQFDPLRDEGLLYFSRLRSLGVPATLSFLPKALHAEVMLSDITAIAPSTASTKGLKDIFDFVNGAL